jgi:hypothetical protein
MYGTHLAERREQGRAGVQMRRVDVTHARGMPVVDEQF